MPRHTADEIRVATATLRTEAGTWDRSAEALAQVSARSRSLTISQLSAGPFQLTVAAHNDAANLVADRTQRGAEVMGEIADTLRATAKTYDDEEAREVHAFRSLY